MITVGEPNAADRSAMLELVGLAGEADGVRPVNESAELVISGSRQGSFVLARSGAEIVGFAVIDNSKFSSGVQTDIPDCWAIWGKKPPTLFGAFGPG